MASVPKNKSQKWNRKSIEIFLVGYNKITKVYRLINSKINNLVISRGFTIIEETKKYVLVGTSP